MGVAVGALGRLLQDYQTEVSEVRVGRTTLKVLDVDPSDETLQRQEAAGLEGRGELPYWTRIWPATMVLAKLLLERPSRPGERLLELGAGRGLVGLFAATAGYRVTISDASALALDFSRATAELNDLEGVDFQVVDWTDPGIMPRFDVIVGSEILYLKSQFPAMVAFLKTHLEPGGEVFLSHGRWPISREFFAYLGRDFETRGREVSLRGRDGEDVKVALHRVRWLKPGPRPH